jgi:pyridoxal phosphate enzyme (YggS family)
MLKEQEIAERLAAVRLRMAEAARLAGREPSSVRLVLASKTQPPQALAAAFVAGAREFGENYVQEGLIKRAVLVDLDIRWHLIGHLQTNKARAAIRTFNLIQTLDSERLAAVLFRLSPSPLMPVLIEINLAGESSKAGIAPERAEAFINSVRHQVDIQGLMTIPPAVGPAKARQFFAQLRELRDHLATRTGLALPDLSMGMTDDFEMAILEGATIVRVGRAIFGERALS